MTITFRKATAGDVDALLALFDNVFTAEEAGFTHVGWKRGIYPNRTLLTDALARDDLFVEEAEEAIVGTAIINQLQGDYYTGAPWIVDTNPDNVMVMHAFAVDPQSRKKGYGRAMLDFAERHAIAQGCTTLRLDTSEHNSGALRLYERFGFERIITKANHFDGFGTLNMVLLEKPLSKTAPTFRLATTDDLDAIAAIYERIHDEEEAGHTTIGWKRGIYPTHATAESALERGDLFICEKEGNILGSAILNHLQGEEYTDAPWQTAADGDQVLVMHTLVITPAAKGHGLGTAFTQFYERRARSLGCCALRIDTNKRNAPARSLYKKLGFREVITLPCQFNGIDGVELVLLEKTIGA